MSADFFDTTIGEQVTLQRGFDITKKQQKPGNIPVVSSGGVSSYHNKAMVAGPGVVLGRKGSLGTVFYIDEDYWPHDTSLWVKNFKGNNPRFVYYYFISIAEMLKKMDVGAANPALNRNHVHPLPIKWTIRENQDVIVNILASLDDKIELNRQINQTLEQIAQAIFKSWFVDFDPVKAKIDAKQSGQDTERAAMCAISGKTDDELGQLSPGQREQLAATAALFPDELVDSDMGLIPKGWICKSLREVIELNPKRVLKKGEVGTYLDMKNMPTQGHLAQDWWPRKMGSGTKFINGDTLLARITPCLENGKTAFVDFLQANEVGWGSTEYVVMRAIDPYPLEYSYLIARDSTFRSYAIQNMTGTSGRQRVSARSLESYPIVVTDNTEIYIKFSTVIATIMTQIKSHGNQNKTLSQLRDTLLPKLLSGEISVGNAKAEIKEAV